MAPQVFSLVDIPLLLFLAGFETLLSADNSLAMAMIAKKLQPIEQKRALFIGIWAGLIFRLLAVIFASHLIHYPSIQVIGGIYLVFLATRHFFPSKETKPARSFWGAVALIELTDLLFAIDSILAALALVKSFDANVSSKLWLIYSGGAIGLVTMRFAAAYIVRLLHHFPRLEVMTHIGIAIIGLKLIFEPILAAPVDWIFWPILITTLALGFVKKTKNR